MPFYLDSHEGADLGESAREMLHRRMRCGLADAHGVIDRGVILDHASNRMYCLLEAPDTRAVERHHEAFGLDVEQIREVDVIVPMLAL